MAIKYRADIDGLRAVAVILVILFHINPNWVPNGYIGVDIFFVLSGFLITSIIYKEMIEGSFSITQFYIRRMKRILPAFFTVLFFALFTGLWLFEEKDISGLYKSALSSVLFLSNIYFARNTGYFDASSDEKPLLHFWSLSVEEQFYFVFPIMLFCLIRYYFLFKKKWFVLVSLLVLLILSSLISYNWQIYYLSHLRFIEMLSGAILAILLKEKKVKLSPRNSLVIGFFCYFILIYISFLEYIPTPPLSI